MEKCASSSLNLACCASLIPEYDRSKEEKPTMKPRVQAKSKFKGKAKEKEEGVAGMDGYRDRGTLKRMDSCDEADWGGCSC